MCVNNNFPLPSILSNFSVIFVMSIVILYFLVPDSLRANGNSNIFWYLIHLEQTAIVLFSCT